MNSFRKSSKTEAESWRMIEDRVRDMFADFFRFNDDGPRSNKNPFAGDRDSLISLQAICDGVGRSKMDGSVITVELKAEERYTGNLFLEAQSNYAFRRHKAGWFKTSRANLLIYHFIDRDAMFVLDMPKLQKWAFELVGDRTKKPRIETYRLAAQQQAEQMNVTVGHVVPIADILEAVGSMRGTTQPVPLAVAG